VFRDPWFAPALRHQTCRFRQKPGTEEGAILSQDGMIPKSGYRFSGKILPKHVSEDANDQAPRGEVQNRPPARPEHLGSPEVTHQQA
jgi:hypothetical protein